MNKKNSGRYYLLGTLVLIAIIGAHIYLNTSNKLTTAIDEFIYSKQQIQDELGPIKSMRYTDAPFWPDKTKEYRLVVDLTGDRAAGQIHLSAKQQNGLWALSNITLTTKKRTLSLSPAFVARVDLYAASLNSAPLKDPIFVFGEDMYLRVFLRAAASAPPNIISEGLEIFNDANELVIENPQMAKTKLMEVQTATVSFTNKISFLGPGLYHARFWFEDAGAKLIESYWLDFSVTETKNSLLVQSVAYFAGPAMKQVTEPSFSADQEFSVRMSVSGYQTDLAGNISGFAALKITDSKGDLVVYKPRFASFNHTVDSNKYIAIEGRLKLKNPDIYLLSFKITDFIAGQSITHDEKVIVRMQ
ncbi:MAG: hypothetical protein HQM16_05950 [Deltaproteobacteria bacterium]|nr:hypothetical protein [Deltaproteobacteria bacterium]